MTYTHTSRLYFVPLLFVLFSERCLPAATLSVKCVIINLEYVECTWHPKASNMNYTFSSAFVDNTLYKDCPEYMLKEKYTIGCRIPLKHQEEKFNKFFTNISTGGHQSISQVFQSLQRYVQLNPPYNLTSMWFEQNSTLVLRWKSSTHISNNCIVYMVHQQTDTELLMYINVTEASYSQPLVSPNKRYSFRVRSTLSDLCGPSNLWSNWSPWLEWGSTENRSVWWQGFFVLLAVLLLFLLVMLLCYCERTKISLLPIVPDPTKNLQDLFRKHDGNVESWVHISRELKEAFEPDYTEPSCNVCAVTSSCDVISTTVANNSFQADTCDTTNTEAQPAEQFSL